MARAKKGGEIGTNGEFYEGGKFLPSTTNPKQSPAAKKAPKARKIEIERFKWVEVFNGERSIYQQLAGIHKFDRENNTFTFNTNINFQAFNPNCDAEKAIAEDKELIERYNNGERFV